MTRAKGDEAAERAVLEQIGLPIEHVPDADSQRYDAVTTGAIVSSTHSRLFGVLRIGEALPVELKTCQQWVTDRHAETGRRRGRWKIARDAHAWLREHDGIYLLAVLDGDDVLAWALTPAVEFAEHLAWTNGGDSPGREETTQVRWAEVFDADALGELEEGVA